ncbi:unnamed protein product [Tetraodon nigroviridis]|uniref:(spotted green pufferfish) hypothetical protein n=1 Tax=Tetraodon nigroviridis TaxID=99883 RepID=Q4SN55_TETNG|nr:unnamed protein product [Tetraodon nigroviridis]
MEYSEKVLAGTGEVEMDLNIVSEEAGELYTELQAVIQTHGEGAVESVVPIFVWVLEGLASYKTQLRDKKVEVERERAEREHLLERTPIRPKHTELSSDQVLPEPRAHIIKRPHSNSLPPGFGNLSANGEKRNEHADPTSNHFINEIISSTPELGHFEGYMDSSTPVSRANTKDSARGQLDPSLKDEIGEVGKEEGEEEHKDDEEQAGEKRDDEDGEEDADVELEQRNTDSVFSELLELSHDYVESVDQGASVRGSTDQFEQILAQYEELKTTFELVDTARKALIWRVVELTDDRFTLQLEVSSLQETVLRLEGRIKEKEEETRRQNWTLTGPRILMMRLPIQSSAATSAGYFSRSEMARVVMEKNQYKQRLFELQEALRHSEMLR